MKIFNSRKNETPVLKQDSLNNFPREIDTMEEFEYHVAKCPNCRDPHLCSAHVARRDEIHSAIIAEMDSCYCNGQGICFMCEARIKGY